MSGVCHEDGKDTERKLAWEKPQIEVLDITDTEGGGIPVDESNGGFGAS